MKKVLLSTLVIILGLFTLMFGSAAVILFLNEEIYTPEGIGVISIAFAFAILTGRCVFWLFNPDDS